jgi:hypothetical protein
LWFFLYVVTRSHNLCHEFDELTWVLFLIDNFFFNFILQHWVDCELGFMIYFDLLSTRLFCSHDSSRVFSGLTQLTRVFFLSSLIDTFFYFIFQQWIDYDFMIYFGLLSIKLSCFYYLGHVFYRLTWIDSSCFPIFRLIFFSFSTFNNGFIENWV